LKQKLVIAMMETLLLMMVAQLSALLTKDINAQDSHQHAQVFVEMVWLLELNNVMTLTLILVMDARTV